MTDREMLELAAKAAGIGSLWWTKDGNKLFRRNGGEQKPWNPLTDDGDALRLAVKLRLHSVLETARRSVDYEKDPYAATRLAITSAAAEIERQQ